MDKPVGHTHLEKGWRLQSYSAALKGAFPLLSPYLSCFPFSLGLTAWVCLFYNECFPP